MKLYAILLCLFIFGFVTAGINESNMFTHKMPETSIGFNESDVQEITEGMQAVGTNPVSAIAMIGLFLRVFASAVLALVTSLPIMMSWGCPIWAAMMVQGPVWFVEVVGLYQFATGHTMMGME
jgi:hypothetical protein